MRLLARILPLGLLAALAVAAAGCGGVALDPVASAATKSGDAGSFRFAFSLSVGAGGDARQGIAGEGAYDADAKRVRATGGLGGERVELVADVSDAPAVYVRPPAETRWVKVDLAQAAKQGGVDLGTLPQEQLDPREAFDALKRAGTSTKVGEETIGGVETTRYRVTLDPAKALEGAGAKERKQAEQALSLTGAGDVPLDVWVDGDGLLRRVEASIGGDEALFSVRMRLDLSDYGSDVHVELPPPDEVTDAPLPLPHPGG